MMEVLVRFLYWIFKLRLQFCVVPRYILAFSSIIFGFSLIFRVMWFAIDLCCVDCNPGYFDVGIYRVYD